MLNNEYYALKEIPKLKLTKDKEIICHLNEPNILKKLSNYNFFPKLISSFQDYDNLYLVTNYYEGVSLYYYKDKNMTEEQLKFISACIIQSFFYLRKHKIIHRDIRMQNIIIDKNKYLNLLDFSYAINYTHKNDFNNYVIGSSYDNAPEIQNLSLYDFNSDYYRLGGSILYYFIFKNYLNNVKKEKKINEIIVSNISNYSSSCIDFLNKLIITDYKLRIGFNNINELKNHLWFKNFDWEKFSKKTMKSPLNFTKKIIKYSFCKKFIFTINNKKSLKKKVKENIFNKLIVKYDYVNPQIIKNMLKINKIYKKLKYIIFFKKIFNNIFY